MRHYNGFLFNALLLNNSAYAINFTGKPKVLTSPLTSLKEKKKLNKLSIIASGPSVKDLKLNELQQTDIALVNGSILLLKHIDTTSKCVFFLVTDPNFIKLNLHNIKNNMNSKTNCIFSMRAFYELIQTDYEFVSLHQKNIFIIDQLHEPYKNHKQKIADLKSKTILNSPYVFDPTTSYGFSKNLENGVFNGGTVVYSMLQAAAYLNYSSIDIYGVDLGGCKRFYEETSTAPSRLDVEFQDLILPCMRLASEYFKTQKTDVINYSLNSKLPESVFPKKAPTHILKDA